MTLMATLTLVDEAEDSVQYAEQSKGDSPPAIGAVRIQRWAVPKPAPSAIRVTLDFYEPTQPAPTHLESAVAHVSRFDEGALHQGDAVAIVKNTTAGIKYPPEWLQQYLGRTGTILWTTAGGAMVKLDDEATWFPYAELKVAD